MKLLLIHHFPLTSVTGVTVMAAEMLKRIPAADASSEVSYLAFEGFATTREFEDVLEKNYRDADVVIGANIHIEVYWEFSRVLARWCDRQSVPLCDNVQDYWPQHRENLKELTRDFGVTLAAASPFIAASLATEGFSSVLTPMGAQLPPGKAPLDSPRKVIASVGRLIRRKRLPDIARAFCSAGLDKCASLSLTLLRSHVFASEQDEEQLSAIISEVERPGVRRQAVNLRFTPQVPPEYSSQSIYVCASDYEGFSMPPYEAAYCGCAPILSDIPPHRRMAAALFGERAPDFLYPVGAVDILGERLKDEIATGRRQRLVHAELAQIRYTIEEQFSLETTAKAFIQLCRDLSRARCFAARGGIS